MNEIQSLPSGDQTILLQIRLWNHIWNLILQSLPCLIDIANKLLLGNACLLYTSAASQKEKIPIAVEESPMVIEGPSTNIAGRFSCVALAKGSSISIAKLSTGFGVW